MAELSGSNPLGWAGTLLRAFYREGVRHIYISPGSRSTPLTLAAALHPGFSRHVVLDERSAAFQALGSAKADGVPALLICTSGTALANYHPAVVEARHAGVPMIILSADRPPNLRGTGSSQTIDQIKFFGDSVLLFHELGEPRGEHRDLQRLGLLARQAVGTATRQGGPVHLNAPFRKPLEPTGEQLHQEKIRMEQEALLPSETPDYPIRNGLSQPGRTLPPSPLPDEALRLLERSERPLLIAGPDERCRAATGLAEQLHNQLGIPMIAEPGSHMPGSMAPLRRFEIVMEAATGGTNTPDLIIRTGDLPYSRSLLRLERRLPEIPVLHFTTRDIWPQGSGRIDQRILIDSTRPDLNGPNRFNPEWFRLWQQMEREAETLLAGQLTSCSQLTDGHVCHHLTRLLHGPWNLMASNSFTVRDLALFGAHPLPDVRLFTNRGAAGIDGIVSTGIGLLNQSNRRTAILAGDLALLHDSNALANLASRKNAPLILVINNGGGTIFRMLPIYHSAPEYYRDYFETPQQADLSALAAMHGLRYRQIGSVRDLERLQPFTDSDPAGELIEFRTDPDESMELRKRLWNHYLPG